MNYSDIISISVTVDAAYTSFGFWEDIKNFPNKTREEIRGALIARFRDRFPDALRITVTFAPSSL